MSRREWVRHHFKPLELEPPRPAWAGPEEASQKQRRLARNRNTRAWARVIRPIVEPDIVEIMEALPAKVWDRIRRGRPALYFSMVDPEGFGDSLDTEVRGPYGRTYEVHIGWCPMPDGDIGFSSPDLAATLAHEIGHVVAGHQCNHKVDEWSEAEEQRLQMEADQLAAEWGFGSRFIACLQGSARELRWHLRQGELDDDGREWTKDSLKLLRQRIRALKAASAMIGESRARP